MLSGKNENGINYYTARKLKDMAQSLEQLAKAFDEGAGETMNLTKDDGLAAVTVADAAFMQTVKKKTVIICIIFCVYLNRTGGSAQRICRSFLRRTAAGNGIT